ncbi:MAG: protein translocase subunit SecF [Spirochaetales bacterium]|nr:protein translocase subunit SecF [Spirochaetales bacterium]
MKVKEFVKHRYLFFGLSVLVIAVGVVTMAVNGFNLGVDFSTGINISVDVVVSDSDTADSVAVRDRLRQLEVLAGETVYVQDAGTNGNLKSFVIKTKVPEVLGSDGVALEYSDAAVAINTAILAELADMYGDADLTTAEERNTYSLVDPTQSSENALMAALLALLVLVLILVYITFRFKIAYAVASIVALIHDVLIMLGVIALFKFEVNTITITALLTVVGYSLNDTIVVFDRIRENSGLLKDKPLATVINTSITQSLSRTIITSLTTLVAVLAIAIIASGDIKYFGINMIVGIIVGTYSSIFVASPVYLELTNLFVKKKARKKGHSGPVVVAASGEVYKEERDIDYDNIEIPRIERKLKRKPKK